MQKDDRGRNNVVWVKRPGIVARFAFLAVGLTAALRLDAATVNVDCNKGRSVGRILSKLKPGDVVLLRGMCRENIVIQPEVPRITVDGQGKAIVDAMNASEPAIQVLAREITIRGLVVRGGSFGISVNRGASAVIDNNTIQKVARSGLEVSQNSFARITNNTIEQNGRHGIIVLGSSSAHIGVIFTDDKVPSPNVVRDNGGDGIWVVRASTARIIGNTLSGNARNGITVQQSSHADVAGNVIEGNGHDGIYVSGNSGLNLADSAMRLFLKPNTTKVPNGQFGIRCGVGAYVEGSIGSLNGNSGAKDASDTSCIDRSAP